MRYADLKLEQICYQKYHNSKRFPLKVDYINNLLIYAIMNYQISAKSCVNVFHHLGNESNEKQFSKHGKDKQGNGLILGPVLRIRIRSDLNLFGRIRIRSIVRIRQQKVIKQDRNVISQIFFYIYIRYNQQTVNKTKQSDCQHNKYRYLLVMNQKFKKEKF